MIDLPDRISMRLTDHLRAELSDISGLLARLNGESPPNVTALITAAITQAVITLRRDVLSRPDKCGKRRQRRGHPKAHRRSS